MNAAMKEQHFSRINDERARRVYDYLCASCELREGGRMRIKCWYTTTPMRSR